MDLASLTAYPERASRLGDDDLAQAEQLLRARVQAYESQFRQQNRRPPRADELAPVMGDMRALVAVRKERKERGRLVGSPSSASLNGPATSASTPAGGVGGRSAAAVTAGTDAAALPSPPIHVGDIEPSLYDVTSQWLYSLYESSPFGPSKKGAQGSGHAHNGVAGPGVIVPADPGPGPGAGAGVDAAPAAQLWRSDGAEDPIGAATRSPRESGERLAPSPAGGPVDAASASGARREPSEGRGARYSEHPQVQEMMATLKLQSAFRGHAVRRLVMSGSPPGAPGADSVQPSARSSDRLSQLSERRNQAIAQIKVPMELVVDRTDCLAALFFNERRVRWLVWMVQTPHLSALTVLMSFGYSAHQLLLFWLDDDMPIFMAVNFAVASFCISAQVLTMNNALAILAHRVFEAWLNYFNVARFSLALVVTFKHFWYKVYLVPSLAGAILLWNSADAVRAAASRAAASRARRRRGLGAHSSCPVRSPCDHAAPQMQMPRWLREYIGYWLLVYWGVLIYCNSRLIMFEEVTTVLPGFAYRVSANDHLNSALLVLMAFVAKDVVLEMVFPGCCKIIKRKVRKRYERRRIAAVKGVQRIVRTALRPGRRFSSKGKDTDTGPRPGARDDSAHPQSVARKAAGGAALVTTAAAAAAGAVASTLR